MSISENYIRAQQLVESSEYQALRSFLNSLHHADVAEIIEEAQENEIDIIVSYLGNELLAETLVELEGDLFESIISKIDTKVLAKRLLPLLDSDDAVDLLENVSEKQRAQIISQLSETKSNSKIIRILNYPKDTAGSLMGTELVSVSLNLNIRQAIRSIRSQATGLDHVAAVYVIDDNRKLLGLLSLRSFLTNPPNKLVEDIYKKDVVSVKSMDSFIEVSNTMRKYDLLSLPVVGEDDTLLGRITMDDVLEQMQEGNKKEFGLFSGIFGDISVGDNFFKITKARIPWLIIGLFGGLLAASIIRLFENNISVSPEMVFYIPLIAAMAGNVGIQSSSIIVQALAENETIASTSSLLFKEFIVSLLNGGILGLLTIIYFVLFSVQGVLGGLLVSFSLLCVVIFASIFGTVVPLFLHKFKINPALSTGPFITTTSDIVGLIIYFKLVGFSNLF